MTPRQITPEQTAALINILCNQALGPSGPPCSYPKCNCGAFDREIRMVNALIAAGAIDANWKPKT